MRNAFTLIELLVVVTIIVILISLLAPAFDKAVQAAQTAVCLSNQHNIGHAINYYTGEYKKTYPVLDVWWGLMGDSPPASGTSDVTQRPLNKYLGFTANGSRVPVAKCPSDIGDPLIPLDSAYKAVGTSYLPAYAPSNWEPTGYAGVKFVFGHSGGAVNAYGATSALYATPLPSAKYTTLERLDNKVLNMDWVWHANRHTKEIRTRWHRPESDERYISTLFGDYHAEIFNWTKEWIDTDYGGVEVRPYNSSWKWW